MSEIREDIESLNKSQENTDEQMEDVFQAFAKLSAQIQSKTAQLERIKIKGFKNPQ
jgi:CII-binding regulator of phage lambda lysogenization HflD